MCLFFPWCLIACPPELGENLLTLKVRILKHWRIFILFYILLREILGLPGGASGKEYAYHCRRWDMDLNPGSGRSPGVGSGNPLQCSCLENFLPGKLLVINRMCQEGWISMETLWQNSLSLISATSAHDSFQKRMKSILPLLLSLTFFFSLFGAYCIAKGFPIHYWWNRRTCHVCLHNFIHSKIEINLKSAWGRGCVQTSWF